MLNKFFIRSRELKSVDGTGAAAGQDWTSSTALIRRQGKGRVCVGDRICSIPCWASCFAIVYLKENVEFILCSHITEEKQLGRQGNEQILSTKQLWWLLPYLLILSFFYAVPVSTGTVSATQPPWKVIMKFLTLRYYNRLKFWINFRWYFLS